MSDRAEKYRRKIREAIQFIEESEDPVNVKKVADNIYINVMFLSGVLTTLAELGALKKTELGGTHIYEIRDDDAQSDILAQLKS